MSGAAPRRALITGSAGFIGYHLSRRLLEDGWRVAGFDGLTDYYDVGLKRARHAELARFPGFTPHIGLLEDRAALAAAADAAAPDVIVHLAAQAGVRYSIDNPRAYLDANVVGSFNVMEVALAHRVDHLLMASTSSVYGANAKMPYAETDRADTQMSFYAATKKAGEAMAHAWAHIHGLPVTMFRFFTVYGPWGRPDMALFRFTEAIEAGQPIDVYNHGEMWRDFTYIDDLVAGIVALIDAVPARPQDRAESDGARPQDRAESDGARPQDRAESDGARPADRPADPGTIAPGDSPGPVAPGDSLSPVAPGDSLSPVAPFRVVNIGNADPVKLTDFIAALEAALGRRARLNLLPMQPGDVPATWADTALLERLTGARPQTPLAEGVAAFVAWYRAYARA